MEMKSRVFNCAEYFPLDFCGHNYLFHSQLSIALPFPPYLVASSMATLAYNYANRPCDPAFASFPIPLLGWDRWMNIWRMVTQITMIDGCTQKMTDQLTNCNCNLSGFVGIAFQEKYNQSLCHGRKLSKIFLLFWQPYLTISIVYYQVSILMS